MQSTQHSLCRVLLHPACTSNPDAIRAVQRATGLLVVINGGKPKLTSKPNFHFATGHMDALPTDKAARRYLVIDEITTDPFGGDAA